LFRAVVELVGELFLKKDHEFAGGRAVLGSAKAKDIDARFPGDRFRRAFERGDRVGKPRAVHVHEHRMLPGEPADRFDFVTPIDSP
jgi:hypothetical protein